jgi:AraC-like DNA-binding protein
MSHLDALMLLSIGQCLFVAIVLGLSPRHQDPADRWMGATLLAVCLNSIVNLAHPQLPTGYDMPANAVAFLTAAAVAPCVWLHIAHVTGHAEPPGARWLHLAVMPPLLLLAVLATTSTDLQLARGVFITMEILLHGQQAIYLALIARRLMRPPGLDILLAEDLLRLRWTRRLLATLVGLWLTSLLSQALFIAGKVDVGQERWFDLPLTLGFLVLSFLAFERPRAVIGRIETAIEAAPPPPESQKYRRSGLKSAERAEIAARLRAALADEAILTDPKMSLPRMAKLLGGALNDVSQAANQELGQSFPDLLTEARIALAMRRLCEPALAEKTVLEVALDVGFNSKSTFNAAFKRQTGMTPTAWRVRTDLPA